MERTIGRTISARAILKAGAAFTTLAGAIGGGYIAIQLFFQAELVVKAAVVLGSVVAGYVLYKASGNPNISEE